MQLTIISGRAGAGKSACLHLLEDLSYYCIDNLPVSLLPALIEQLSTKHARVAVNIDARNLPADLNRFTQIINDLKKTTTHCEIIFLDAEDNILLKRFSETRRKHPLSSTKIPLQEALINEKQLLEPIAHLADLRIDTSYLTVQQLRELLRVRITQKKTDEISLLFESFGYKFGVPLDTDYVFDARCLPNPYWEPSLRKHTGKDKAVAEFLQQQPATQQLLDDIKNFLEKWLPQFESSNRSYLTVAIGCTGGQHRSVYLVEQLANHFRKTYPHIQIRHREI